MSSIIITYNGKTIAEVSEGKTATLHCKGRIPTTDIIARFEADGKVMYDGKLFSIPAKYNIKLHCADRRMMSDVVMMTGGNAGEYGCVLGSARLGATMLGVAERLEAPVISLVADKLDTPTISMVTEKLGTPVIGLVEETT